MTYRYALYFAPPAGASLATLGARWLGRDPETGDRVEQPMVDGISAGRLAALTASPRRYGFHGTLKPPFRLKEGTTGDGLRSAVADFARQTPSFEGPALALATLGGFLALIPAAPCEPLRTFAGACVETFDAFRAPPSDDELERRRSKGLSDRQEHYLARWGYPYVFEEFRFHLTLSERIHDLVERDRLVAALTPMVAPHTTAPLSVTELCLFRQDAPDAAFVVEDRFALGG